MYNTIEISRAGAVVTVSLNRPQVRNAFDARMIEELTEVFTYLASESEARAVILRGNGRAFCAGADANWMRASLGFTMEENRLDAERMSDMFYVLDSLPLPLIASVHGASLGGGMGLLAVCDIVVASEATVFGFTESKLGIIPAVISRFVLPKLGPSWARALFLTGERFEAELAMRIGLVHWVVPGEELDATVDQKVQELLTSGPVAVREVKRLVSEGLRLDSMEMRSYTAEHIARLRVSAEGQEGLRAFLEKRKPEWA